MKPNKRIAAAIASATLVLGVGAGLADAAQKNPAKKGNVAGQMKPGPGPGSKAIADYLGLTAAELRTQLKAGQTLAQIATAQGKTVSGLKDAIVADAKTHLDAAVAAGKLTAARAATMLADLTAHVDDIVNRTGPPGRGPGGPGGPGHGPFAGAAITSYLGITAAELRTQVKAGKTLAQVATAQGKTVSGLEDAIVAGAKTRLDAEVAAGKLTAAQAATMLANLTAHVDDMVNRTGPPPGGHRGPGGPGFGPKISATA
jgi:hypothetical protein